jgi:NADPH-dependent 2,4-dienoyl-CoA reductase/sulfur reductase-like enzyme
VHFHKCVCMQVVIGSSFIGMEAAASLAKHGADVTIVGMESKPFERVLGPRVGTAFQNLLNEKNVKFLGNSTVKLFR